MKKLTLLTILFCCCLGFEHQAQAQENYTEGPVWVINYYRTKPGKFDEYMKFLRANFAKNVAKQKQAGVVVDGKVQRRESCDLWRCDSRSMRNQQFDRAAVRDLGFFDPCLCFADVIPRQINMRDIKIHTLFILIIQLNKFL